LDDRVTVTHTQPLPPIFQRLAGANLAAQAAEQISLAAVPIVAVLSLGAGAAQIGTLALAGFVLQAALVWASPIRALSVLQGNNP
jgi:hypothetical protein